MAAPARLALVILSMALSLTPMTLAGDPQCVDAHTYQVGEPAAVHPSTGELIGVVVTENAVGEGATVSILLDPSACTPMVFAGPMYAVLQSTSPPQPDPSQVVALLP